MYSTRITRPRRIFVDILTQHAPITFSELKRILVGKGNDKIDLTTLYRMVEMFEEQGLLHVLHHNNEKTIFLSGENFQIHRDAVEISFCENCGNISAKYFPLDNNTTKSTTTKFVKSCDHCPKNPL